MRPSPPFTDLPRYPITGGLILMAAGVTLAWAAKVDIEPILCTVMVRRGQLWRLATAVLPHVNVFHLAFNAYWMWAFGTAVERAFGPVRTLALYAALAAGPMAAEYAVFEGGVGLSGVVYGLWGLLLVLGPRDDRFEGYVDRNVYGLFTAWFFICIGLTVTNIMPVANVAHGVGAVLGGAIGGCLVWRGGRRVAAAAGVVAFTAGAVAAAVFARPYVNLGRGPTGEAAQGATDLIAGRNAVALRWLDDAVRLRPGDAGNWNNLGIARLRLGQTDAANAAFARARALQSTGGNPPGGV